MPCWVGSEAKISPVLVMLMREPTGIVMGPPSWPCTMWPEPVSSTPLGLTRRSPRRVNASFPSLPITPMTVLWFMDTSKSRPVTIKGPASKRTRSVVYRRGCKRESKPSPTAWCGWMVASKVCLKPTVVTLAMSLDNCCRIKRSSLIAAIALKDKRSMSVS